MTTPQMFDLLLRTQFLVFLERVFNELHPPSTYVRNWHVAAIAHALDRVRRGDSKRFILNVPPRSLKSLTVSVAWAAFILGHNPAARLICVSYSQPLAAALARAFRRIVTIPWYQRNFPAMLIAKDTEEMIETTQGGFRMATSIGGALTGFGADFILIDDPMKAEDAMSEAARDKVNQWYSGSLYSRLNTKTEGAIIVVMQRLHQDDLSGYLLGQGGWDQLRLPAIAIEEEMIPIGNGQVHNRRPGDLLQPDREPLWVLDQARAVLGGPAFEAQYQQNPLPSTGNMLDVGWIRRYQQRPDRDRGRLILSWDTAVKGDPACDFSVCTIWQGRDYRHYLIDVIRKRLDFPGLRRLALELHAQWRPDATLIEDTGSGSSLIQELKHNGIYPIPCRPEKDKISRFAAVTPMFEAGQVLLPQEADWLADLTRELLGFPNTRYDDQIDSISQYLLWARGKGPDRFDVDWGWDDLAPNHDSLAGRLAYARGYTRGY